LPEAANLPFVKGLAKVELSVKIHRIWHFGKKCCVIAAEFAARRRTFSNQRLAAVIEYAPRCNK